jgi:coenzyme F420-0:L-glutamate ligase/coenzyme F420-1:gamma-L-glutamate ligase
MNGKVKKIEFFAPEGLPLIDAGTDLAEIITRAFRLEDRDIVVICSTIVSKSEGRIRKLSDYIPSEEAVRLASRIEKPPEFVQAVLEESSEVLIEAPFLLVKARFGNICINAGIDESNIEKEYIILPPENPDRSAERIRRRLESLTGKTIGVIITDTNGRCFRKGVTGFAIGISRVKAMKNWIGDVDLYGNPLEVTVEAVADEIAAMANLLMGEGADGLPVVIVRGLDLIGEGSMDEIYRSEEEDIIRQIIKQNRNKNHQTKTGRN